MNVYIFFLSFLISIIFIKNILLTYKLELNDSIDIKYNNRKKTNVGNVLYFLFSFVIFLFSALRYDVGWDYWAYYETIKYGISTNIMNNGEILTILLVNISKFLNEPQVFFIINSGICIFFIANISKKHSKDPWMSMFIFVTFPLFYLNSFSVIRNFSAISIVFYANRYILEKKYMKYIIAVLIASQFHASAVIALVFYPLKHIKIKNSRLIILIAIAPIISKLIRLIVMRVVPQYSIYLSKTTVQEGTKAIIVFFMVAFIFILLMKYIKQNMKSDVIMLHYNNFIFGLLIYSIFLEAGTMGHRLSLYGTISSIILIPEIIYTFRSQKERLLIKMIVYILFSLFFLYIINVGSSTYIPYKTFINR